MPFQQMILEQLEKYMPMCAHTHTHTRIQTQTLHLSQKFNSKGIIDLNVTFKTIRFLENNKKENLGDCEFGSDFADTIPKAQSMKEIIGRLDFIKVKTLYSERHY